MSKSRAILISTATFFVSLLFVFPVHAQTPACTPQCASDETCQYANTAHTETACAVAEITVTAPASTANTGTMTFATFVNNIVVLVNSAVIPLLFALAFIFFLINVVRYMFSSSDENRAKGRKAIMYGLFGMFILFTLWGIVNLALNIVRFG